MFIFTSLCTRHILLYLTEAGRGIYYRTLRYFLNPKYDLFYALVTVFWGDNLKSFNAERHKQVTSFSIRISSNTVVQLGLAALD